MTMNNLKQKHVVLVETEGKGSGKAHDISKSTTEKCCDDEEIESRISVQVSDPEDEEQEHGEDYIVSGVRMNNKRSSRRRRIPRRKYGR